MYSMFMAVDVRSPIPHLFGPPGCGKSTVVEQAAELIGVNLHIINVSRISPLELEGVQMPHTNDDGSMYLKLLTATFWSSLKEGDIILFDEFLRGFPEVYNGLLDIFTSRRVADFVLPRVFIIAASNSTVSYDKALEDRLMHITVPDVRKLKKEKKKLGDIVCQALGLLPEMAGSYEMLAMIDTEVAPMYDILDNIKNKSSAPASGKGNSIRKLIGQAQFREVESSALKDVLNMNNNRALQQGKLQHVFYLNGKSVDSTYAKRAEKMLATQADKLTSVQRSNIELNLQLIEMESVRYEKEGTSDDEVADDTDINDLLS
jgi:hypothetical protein